MSDLGFASWEDSIIEQVAEAIVSDEVETKTQMLDVGGGVLNDTISQSNNTLLSQSIVTDIEEFKGGIDLQELTKGTSTINVD